MTPIRILVASLLLVVSLVLTTNFAFAETPEPDKPATKIVHRPLLEAFYQEVDGRPIVTVMLTNVGQEPFAVVNPFEAYHMRIEVLDIQGKNLLTRQEAGGKKEDFPSNLTRLIPQRGILCRIDLLDSVPGLTLGHGTMLEPEKKFSYHIPAMFISHYSIAPDDVSKIDEIRVTLCGSKDYFSSMFSFEKSVHYYYGTDIEKENLLVGEQRQILVIPLGAKVDRTVPQFGQRIKLAEPVVEQPKNILTPLPTPRP